MFKQNVCCHNKSEKVHINGKQKSQKIKFSMLSEMLIAYENIKVSHVRSVKIIVGSFTHGLDRIVMIDA